MLKIKKGASSREFIEEHSTPVTECGCWLWECSDGDLVKLNGVDTKPDRLAYEAFLCHVPDDFDIVHDCHVSCCVNPKHMHLERHH